MANRETQPIISLISKDKPQRPRRRSRRGDPTERRTPTNLFRIEIAPKASEKRAA